MSNRNLIRNAMLFAVKDITGRVLREATVQTMIDDFLKDLKVNNISMGISYDDLSESFKRSIDSIEDNLK